MLEKKKIKDNVEFTKQQEVKKELVLVDSILPHNNHIVYEIDLNNKTIDIAEVVEQSTLHWFDIIDNKSIEKTIIKKEGFLYVSSLNLKNLIIRANKVWGLDISGFDYIPSRNAVVGTTVTFNIKTFKNGN